MPRSAPTPPTVPREGQGARCEHVPSERSSPSSRPSGWPFAALPAAPGGAASGFPDVPAGAYYHAAGDVARPEGITTGVGSPAEFLPDAPVDRGQTATFLWRYEVAPAGNPAPGFRDFPACDPPPTTTTASAWLREAGLTTGVGGTGAYQPTASASPGARWSRSCGATPAGPPGGRAGRVPRRRRRRLLRPTRSAGPRPPGSRPAWAPPVGSCPTVPITRGQMATFLYRLVGNPLDGGTRPRCARYTDAASMARPSGSRHARLQAATTPPRSRSASTSVPTRKVHLGNRDRRTSRRAARRCATPSAKS